MNWSKQKTRAGHEIKPEQGDLGGTRFWSSDQDIKNKKEKRCLIPSDPHRDNSSRTNLRSRLNFEKSFWDNLKEVYNNKAFPQLQGRN